MIIIFILTLLVIGYIISSNKEQLRLFLITFLISSVYIILTNLLIKNPNIEYFGDPDQPWFYSSAIEFSSYPVFEMFVEAFEKIEYLDLPLIMIWDGLIVKIAKLLGIDSILLAWKLTNACLVGIMAVVIYKIGLIFKIKPDFLFHNIILFALFSPLLYESSQILRDIHVALLYTIMLWLSLQNKAKTIIYLSIIALVLFFIRRESGMFSVVFFFIYIYSNFYTKRSSFVFIVGFVLCIGAISFLSYFLDTMLNVLRGYNEMVQDSASNGSLGAMLDKFPFPLNLLAKFSFGNLMPFPIWHPVIGDDLGHSLRFVQMLTPIYWTPILYITLYYGVKEAKMIDKRIRLMIIIAFVFMIIVSYGQGMTRRLLAVYPMILISYMYLVQNTAIDVKRFSNISYLCITALHILYFFIKF